MSFLKKLIDTLRKAKLLYNTICNIKYIQIRHQILLRFNRSVNLLNIRKPKSFDYIQSSLIFSFTPPGFKYYRGGKKFEYLNIKQEFKKEVDWKFTKHGALWNYNLQYCDFLNQIDIQFNEKIYLLNSIYNSGVKLEPYPVSLRSINVIRFFCNERIRDNELLTSLYWELDFLSKRFEYHLLGNHLLENAFCLCMGGAFFSNENWLNYSLKVLQRELNEQVLDDGAHFELSPMYHQIITYRLLEFVDWYSKYEKNNDEILSLCENKVKLMLSWLYNVSFENGDIPLFNDSAKGIAYETSFLLEYAKQLELNFNDFPLGDSGYRSYQLGSYEIKVDCAQLGAIYQPGHAHADALSFIVYFDGEPLFVEVGTSTYNFGKRRCFERSTRGHNTVVVEDKNQSEVWSIFRVGKRAKTSILSETKSMLSASHDGYKKHGVVHFRKFNFKPQTIQIKDDLNKEAIGEFNLHIHPSFKVKEIKDSLVLLNNGVEVRFEHLKSLTIEDYEYSESFNTYQSAQKIKVTFLKELNTTILFTKV